MNKMKISDSDKRLLIIFFAIVILACSYFFIFNKSMSKASELEATNDEDRIKVQQMETMEAALPQVKENIETMKVGEWDCPLHVHHKYKTIMVRTISIKIKLP